MIKHKQPLDSLLGRIQAKLKMRDTLPEDEVIFLEECQSLVIDLLKEEQSNQKVDMFIRWTPHLVRLLMYLFS